MALVDCKECGKKISSRAAACPNCGAPPISDAETVIGAVNLQTLLKKGTRGASPNTVSAGASDDFAARVRPVSWLVFSLVVMIPINNLGWPAEITIAAVLLATASFTVLLALAKLDKLFPIINLGLLIVLFSALPQQPSQQPQSYPTAEKNKAALERLQKAIDAKEKDCLTKTGVPCDF